VVYWVWRQLRQKGKHHGDYGNGDKNEYTDREITMSATICGGNRFNESIQTDGCGKVIEGRASGMRVREVENTNKLDVVGFCRNCLLEFPSWQEAVRMNAKLGITKEHMLTDTWWRRTLPEQFEDF